MKKEGTSEFIFVGSRHHQIVLKTESNFTYVITAQTAAEPVLVINPRPINSLWSTSKCNRNPRRDRIVAAGMPKVLSHSRRSDIASLPLWFGRWYYTAVKRAGILHSSHRIHVGVFISGPQEPHVIAALPSTALLGSNCEFNSIEEGAFSFCSTARPHAPRMHHLQVHLE